MRERRESAALPKFRVPHAAARRKTAVLQGSDVREIVRYAANKDADSIFLNALRQPGEGKFDIVRHATVPVMLVP
jgi:nucleotide-binding universal stress UspA family protein